MKLEQIKEITEKVTEQLVAALQQGHSEALTSYLKAIGRFHRYSLLCVPQHRNENVNCGTMPTLKNRHLFLPDRSVVTNKIVFMV
jgi:hypothetical protein